MGIRTCASALALVLAGSLGSLGSSVVAPAAQAVETPAALAVEAPAAEPFTIAVIPDLQGYSVSDNLAASARAQTQWIVDNEDELGIAFTVQLGDLVESWPNTNHWDRISAAFATLDQNAVPYSVLPGNHDIDFATGNAPTYNQYFPVSRFSEAAWNTAEKRYGGHLGSDTFGPDPVNRENMNNFNLFRAGGVDWLLLNLEFESPDYTLAWAQKVLDAYPERRVILATHGFVDARGWRNNALFRTDPGVKTSNEVWNQLVHGNCSIDFVLNGHYYDGDLGEARRTDANACGEPVHQLLSDYQTRANGGDGWLRYYTFDPGAESVEAFTYSVTKQTFETDADSSFTLPYDFAPDPSVSQEAVVRGDSTWKYRYQQGAWPAGWDGAAYDDSAWPSGKAPLGFPTGVVDTNIDLGPPSSSRAPSMLFRRTFDLDDIPGISAFRLVTKADDGLVVSVNGQEVGRTSMPTGPVSPATLATAGPRSMAAQQVVYDVPLSLLEASGNVIAASTHLNYLATTDAHFDLVAVATRSDGAPPPTAENVTLVDDAASWRWRFSSDPWPTTWTSVGYEDSGWAQGAAPLGFGTPVATNIDVPPPTSNRPRSALFRRTFTIDDFTRYTDIKLLSRADDGVVLSLNGTELNRTRLPSGTLTNASYATAAPSTTSATDNPVSVDVPAGLLRNGTNVIAAATVLNYRNTPNASFAARLTAVRSPPTSGSAPSTPTLQVASTTATTASLSWAPAAGPEVTSWVLSRAGATIAELPQTTTSYTDTGLSPGSTYAYTLVAVNAHGTSPPASASATTASATPGVLVGSGASWRWRYASTAPGGGWAGPGFDDSSWSSGEGPFGFGSTLVNTDIGDGAPSPRPLTAQFRTTFEVADVNEIESGEFSFVADDGVVVYLNGVEVGRQNLPAGTITSNTYATAAPRSTGANANPVVVSIPASALVNGTNVVAAQTHLNYRSTPDALFRLTLSSTPRDPGAPDPPAAPVVSGEALSSSSVRLTWPDQEAAGGFIVERDNVQVGTPASGATSFTDTGLSPETAYSYTVTAIGAAGQQTSSAPVQVTTPAPPPPPPSSAALVGSTASWRWRYASTAPAGGWASAGFDDSSWSSGEGPFGFGSTLVNTDIGDGAPSPRPLTAQFRTTFEVADVNEIESGEFSFVADDGVVVYLNGVEVGRQNLPAGTITSNTYATAAPRSTGTNANPVVVSVPASALVNGTNVVAAQTHLNYRNTPDALFRLTLTPEP